MSTGPQRLHTCQRLQMNQPCVSHYGVQELQRFQTRQSLDMYQSGVRHRGVVEQQRLQELRAVNPRPEKTSRR